MSQSDTTEKILIAGGGYAGLQVAVRSSAWLKDRAQVSATLVDQHDYHEIIPELPDVAAGDRPVTDVRQPLARLVGQQVTFLQSTLVGFDLAGRRLITQAGPLPYTRLVLGLGSQSNSYGVPGVPQHTLNLYSDDAATRVWDAVNTSVDSAAKEHDPEQVRRLLTVVVGGGGATGVEVAGDIAEQLPELARKRGLSPELARVVIVQRGPSILAGSSPDLVAKATQTLDQLGAQVRTNSPIAAATADGFKLEDGELVRGGVLVWAGGMKAPDVVFASGLPIMRDGRVKVDPYLRVEDHPEIYVGGDLAFVLDPATSHPLAPLAQTAIDEGDNVARNLQADLEQRPLEPFVFHSKGFVVAVGRHGGVADVAGHAVGGRLAHALREAIEWEYRQSVAHLHGWETL
ncbi:MAG: FAD-dependent oxidoreductase [Chloroflexi bacterium]|nr:FAD-dependent oxidoreductase [Chloroflexota bacterium]